jgi:hypothetical protein
MVEAGIDAEASGEPTLKMVSPGREFTQPGLSLRVLSVLYFCF